MAAPSVASLQRAYYTVSLLLIAVVILYYAQVVFIPVALSILLAFILSPLVDWLEARGLWRTLSVLLVTLLAFAVLGLVFWVAGAQVRNLARQLPEHETNIARKFAGLRDLLERVRQFTNLGAAAGGQSGTAAAGPGETASPVVVEPAGSSFLAWVPAIAQPVLEVLARVLLVIVLTIFMVLRRENLRDRLLRLVGHGNVTSTTKALDEAGQRVSRYLLSQLATNTLVGLGVTLGLLILGVPYAFLWGFLTIALRFIPYVGVWVAALFPFAFSAALSPGWTQPLIVLGLYLGLELLTANVVEPLLFSHSTGVSPIALLVVAVFWAWLWGPVGLLMSTPLTVCLVVLGQRVPNLEFFDVLLGEPPALDVSARFYQRLVARDYDDALALVQDYLKSQPVDSVYDGVLLPAVAWAKRDRGRNELTAEDERFIFRATRDVLDQALFAGRRESGENPAAREEPARLRIVVLGYPAQGEADGVALRLLQYLLRPSGCLVHVVSARKSFARLVSLVEQRRPAAVCIATLPPSGLSQVCRLARRLRSKFPGLKIVAARWGSTDEGGQGEDCLRSSGVDHFGTSILETRDQLLALVEPAPTPQPA